jgi:hypothetical protein
MVLFSIRQQACPPMTALKIKDLRIKGLRIKGLKIKSLRIKGLKIPPDHKSLGYFVINLNSIHTSFDLLAMIELALV